MNQLQDKLPYLCTHFRIWVNSKENGLLHKFEAAATSVYMDL